MTATAYCFRSGQIRVGRRCPDGALPLAYGPEHRLRRAVSGCARLARSGETWLVPGVPEASNEDEGIEAARLFSARLTQGDALLVPAIARLQP